MFFIQNVCSGYVVLSYVIIDTHYARTSYTTTHHMYLRIFKSLCGAVLSPYLANFVFVIFSKIGEKSDQIHCEVF